jgi:hypothetical protein
VARNPVGEDSTGGTLNVVPEKTDKDKGPELGQPQGKTPRPLKMIPGTDFQPTSSQPETNRAPRVIVPLNDGEVKETMPALLTATVDAGSPMATVRICCAVPYFNDRSHE